MEVGIDIGALRAGPLTTRAIAGAQDTFYVGNLKGVGREPPNRPSFSERMRSARG